MTLLSVRDLRTHFVTRDGLDQVRTARALNGVSFEVQKGRILGLVGESGAGKSLTVTSILGLLRPPARVVAGEALFEGHDLLTMPTPALSALRGNRIGLIVQSPKASLDPLSRIGDQLVRVQRAHVQCSRLEAMDRAEAILAAVGIPDPRRRLRAWPHEFSGGMAQRAVIALALVNQPQLVIADEPTTALDVTVQAQILDLLAAQVRERGISAIVVTHDLGVVAQYCDDVAVMFAGTVVEQGPSAKVFRRPMHPYTQTLLAATPERLRPGSGARLGGPPPDLYALPDGCLYRLRCDRPTERCGDTPALIADGAQVAACHFAVPKGGSVFSDVATGARG
jgi:oligopeptide/dipeptide ABC transporter ATP-binding protein